MSFKKLGTMGKGQRESVVSSEGWLTVQKLFLFAETDNKEGGKVGGNLS